MDTLTLAFIMPGPTEWIIIGGIALLIFGRRLPEVARAMGNSIVEFKRGINDVQNEIEDNSTKPANPLESAPSENKVRPLEPFDERLGGDKDDLQNLQSESTTTQA